MQLSRRAFDAYNAAVKKQGDSAEDAACKALDVWFAERPDASIAETRSFCIALICEVGAVYGNAAGDAAYALRGIIADAAGVELPAVDYVYEPEQEFVDRTARYQVEKLKVGDISAFADAVAYATRYFSERSANDTMAALGKADAKKLGKKVRFARVPTGATTCPYCCMLASRGFVYHSGLTALNANHRHCDCRIVEGFPGMTVEGYDPDEYYDRWKHPEKYEEEPGMSDAFEFTQRIEDVSIDSCLKAINPNYRTGEEKWTRNCQRCVYAYEMRRRGNDVTALPRPENDTVMKNGGWRRIFADMEWNKYDGKGLFQIKRQMEEWGDGSRAVVYVKWKDNPDSHVFVVERIEGRTVFVDPQTGQQCVRYFTQVVDGMTELARIDDKDPTPLIVQCCTVVDDD